MRGAILGGLAAVALLAAPAGAQAPDEGEKPEPQKLMDAGEGANLRLTLICQGQDAAMVMKSSRSGRKMNSGMGMSRVAAQLGVVVAGETVLVLPPATSLPLLAKSPKDGWFQLTKVAITPTVIRGKATLGAMISERLHIDRRTGRATFGQFAGVCKPAPVNADGTVF